VTDQLLGKPVAEGILGDVRARIDSGRRSGWPTPGLVSVHRALETPFAVYLERQRKTAGQAGIAFRETSLPAATGSLELRTVVSSFNADSTAHAVLVEHPLPETFDFLGALATLRPEKDVDGVGAENLGRLVAQRPVQTPAVALGALAILAHYGIPVRGRRVAVIGRSATVGLPLAILLLARGSGGDATVTVAHTKSVPLPGALKAAEIIFSCAGHPGLLTRENVPRGAVVVDVGLSMRPPSWPAEGPRTVGDANPAEMDGWASAITPVPGGVGPVTVAELMANAVRGWELLNGGR